MPEDVSVVGHSFNSALFLRLFDFFNDEIIHAEDFVHEPPALPLAPSFCHSGMFLSWEEGALTLLKKKEKKKRKRSLAGRKVAEVC